MEHYNMNFNRTYVNQIDASEGDTAHENDPRYATIQAADQRSQGPVIRPYDKLKRSISDNLNNPENQTKKTY